MTSAEYAIGGVIVGAIASGSTQAALARFDRRRSGRAANRILYMQLHNAESAIKDLRKVRRWSGMITDWHAFEKIWEQYREPLALALGTHDFHRVSTAGHPRLLCRGRRAP